MTEEEMKKLIGDSCRIEDVNKVCKDMNLTYEKLIKYGVRNFMNWLGFETK